MNFYPVQPLHWIQPHYSTVTSKLELNIRETISSHVQSWILKMTTMTLLLSGVNAQMCTTPSPGISNPIPHNNKTIPQNLANLNHRQLEEKEKKQAGSNR